MKLGAGWIVGFVFLLLKVAGLTWIADWSWWLVLSPFILCLLIIFISEYRRQKDLSRARDNWDTEE